MMATLPDYCTRGHAIWQSVVPLICFYIIEWHQPDRVLRQFGMRQHVPTNPLQDDSLHTIDLRGRVEESWEDRHATYIQLWGQRAARVANADEAHGSLSEDSTYMQWYRRVTRRWVSRRGATWKNMVHFHLLSPLHLPCSFVINTRLLVRNSNSLKFPNVRLHGSCFLG